MKSSLVLALLLTGVPMAQAQKPKGKATAKPAAVAPVALSGIYEGKLTLPSTIVLRMRMRFNGKGGGTAESPDQGGGELVLDKVTVIKNTVEIEGPRRLWSYTGILSADRKTLSGALVQNGVPLALSLNKVAQVSELRRPQTPKPPFPYQAVEVGFANPAEAGVSLGGTLVVPAGKGPFPCVVFITGSGQQDRDETLFQHKPFAVIADNLARQGVASLRCDDRMVGKSKGDLERANSSHFATDIEAAVAFLKTRPEVDAKKIGLIGHSEGGIIAPMVAAKTENAIAFIVLLAGTGVPGDQVLVAQSEALLKAQGASEGMIAAARANQEKLFPIAKTEPDPQKALDKMAVVLGALDAKSLPAGAVAQLKQLTNPWMRYFLQYDPVLILERVTCPVLALNGTKDTQVLLTQNLPRIEQALKKGNNPDYTIAALPDLNHLFQHAKTGGPAEYGQLEETFSPEALKLIADWILARTK